MSVLDYLTGPQLVKEIQFRCNGLDCGIGVKYRYVDEEGRKTPAYNATYIRVYVFPLVMSPAWVERIFDIVKEMPRLASAKTLTDHPELRPMVKARFYTAPSPV